MISIAANGVHLVATPGDLDPNRYFAAQIVDVLKAFSLDRMSANREDVRDSSHALFVRVLWEASQLAAMLSAWHWGFANHLKYVIKLYFDVVQPHP